MAALLQVHASLSFHRKPPLTQTRGRGQKRKWWTATPRTRSLGQLYQALSLSRAPSLSRTLIRLLGRDHSHARMVWPLWSFFMNQLYYSILLHVGQYFSLLNHREAGAKASCTETKASPGKASTFIFVRQRQVKLLSELLPSQHTDQLPLWILRLMCKRDRCVPPKW